MISKFFINRPIFATVIAIVMVLVGLVTIYTLPVAQFPDITPPTVQVTAVYPGASAETVAKTVGVPIEEQVNGVDGMIYMSSSSSSSGQYTLTVSLLALIIAAAIMRISALSDCINLINKNDTWCILLCFLKEIADT